MGTPSANLRRAGVALGAIRYGLATHFHIDHAGDSVSLLLDGGAVFTGDLTPPAVVTDEQAAAVGASWQRLRERGATQVYPGHGPVVPLCRDGARRA